MKSLNAKKIAAVVAGAALLGVGLAFAGPVTFQNVPIISNSGQPVVQIVVGSTAKPSDGVAAANIAAAIGNLAYTSVPVTASVNATQAQSVLHVAVSSAKYSLANQQVWLNESGSVTSSSTGGTYVFSALIGSVLNQGVQLGSPQNTKTLQASSTNYAFARSASSSAIPTTSSPLPSPYTVANFVPTTTSVVPNNNGGGATFGGFSTGSPASDNLLQVTSAQFSALKSNYGGAGETEYLWLTGFPVFDQASGVNNFQLLDASGAYQVIFNKPIINTTSGNSININQPLTLLGQNYTIINATGPSVSLSGTNAAAGGKIYLASSLAPLQTVYVGHNITSGPWEVQLQDLGQPSSNGVSPASVSVWYKGVLTNESSIQPGTLAKFNISGSLMYLQVNQTFAGLYSYQKWAKLELYTNVWQVQNGKVLNQTTNPGWIADLLWTNTTSGTKAKALYSIILYNATPVNLAPGQSFSFIQNPSIFKLTFLGDTLGSGQYDAMSLQSSTVSNLQYQNLGSTYVGAGGTITNVTEPAQELTVTSQIPNAFSYAGTTSQSVVYDLTAYKLNELAANTPISGGTTNVLVTYTANAPQRWINSTYPLNVQVTGYVSNVASSPITQIATFSALATTNEVIPLSTSLYNVTAIQIQGNRALPVGGGTNAFTIAVSNNDSAAANVVLANLASAAPGEVYTLSGKVYDGFSQGNVIYNQQNGQPTTALLVTQTTSKVTSGSGLYPAQEYYTFQINETEVPGQSTPQDALGVGIFNATSGVTTTPLFQMNYSEANSHNNVTFISYINNGASQAGNTFNVQSGFRTERGSKVASITPDQVTFDLATAVDELQFELTPSSTANVVANHAYSEHGPYTVGQATNLPNVTIGAVNATVQLSGASSYTITGISNITATPSVTSAVTPVWLTNLTSTAPLVVLDSASTNPASSLILVGSGYVNTLSQQLESSYNINVTPSSAPVVQAYGTNKILVAGYYANGTTAAANTFIEQLYAAASK